MIHKNIWKPDTCECEIEYEWDDTEIAQNRTHTVTNILRRCNAHKDIDVNQEVWNVVLDENRRKNIVHTKILDNIPTVVQETIQEDGLITKQIKNGLKYNWSFDIDRNLMVDLVGFKVAEKNTIKTLVNQLFGSKVIIK